MLAYLVAKEMERVSSGIKDKMDYAQIDLLVDAAFRTPAEFNEAATAIIKYGDHATGRSPSPKDEVAMILETLSTYADQSHSFRNLIDKSFTTLRDAIRLIARNVVSSHSPKSN
jgi:hypothetical protein